MTCPQRRPTSWDGLTRGVAVAIVPSLLAWTIIGLLLSKLG